MTPEQLARKKEIERIKQANQDSIVRGLPIGIGRLAKTTGLLAGDALEALTDKETRKKTDNFFSESANFVSDSIDKIPGGDLTQEVLKDMFFPEKVTTGQDVASYFVPFGAATKGLNVATKAIAPVTKLGKATKIGALAVAADVLVRGEDEIYIEEFLEGIPEAEELVAKLAIDPDDSVAERRLKQLIDASLTVPVLAGVGFGAAGVGKGIIKTTSEAGKKIIEKAKSIKKDKVTEPVEETIDSTPISVEVFEETPNQYRQKGKILQTIGKLNTGAGRLFTSKAALPNEVFRSYIKNKQFVEGSDLVIQKKLKDLEKLIKKYNINREQLNLFLEGKSVPLVSKTGRLSPNASKEVSEKALELRKEIDDNQGILKDLLNLNKDDKLSIKFDDNIGSYLTRTFEFTTNPKWSKDISKVLKGQLKGTSGHNADVIRIVQNARQHLQSKNPNLTSAQIDGLIEQIVLSGKKRNQLDIITNMLGNSFGGNTVKILKGRKDIDKPILELLGEVKDPIRNARETLRNQNKLIAKTNYLNDVKKFAEQNVGKEIKLKGLFPFLPDDVATFLNKAEVGVGKKLGELAEKELGKLGGDGKAVGLNNLVTTDDFYKMLESGTDVFGFDNPVGKTWLNIFSKPAAVTQSMETVFDHTAHLVNTYGMFQQLAMNGNLFRPSAFKSAQKSAYDLFQKASKGDENSLKFLQKLKERGVIDSSTVAETVKKNIDRFGEGPEQTLSKVVKAPFRGASAVYGGIDDFGKITAIRLEMAAYKKAFPKATDDEVLDYASEVVRNTMPSYTTAAPAVRALSRFPFGTYATFPAEVLRTSYNILKIGSKDIATGVKTGNKELVGAGLRRLSSAGAVTAGIELAVKDNNEQLGVSETDIRGINLLSPEYQRNTLKVMTKPLYKDPKTGRIMTQFTDSGSLDAHQFIKGPIRAVIGKTLAGQEITDAELDDYFKNAIREVYSPFISEKFLTSALLNVARGVDEEGRPIAPGISFADDALAYSKELGQILVPGSIKAGQRYLDSIQSEMLRGEGEGQTAYGFPLRKEEQKLFFSTGIRNNTMDVSKVMSSSLYKETSEIDKTNKYLRKYFNTLKDKPLTPTDYKNIIDEYVRVSNIKKEKMKKLQDKLEVYTNMSYIDTDEKGEEVTRKFGTSQLYKAATNEMRNSLKMPIQNALNNRYRPDTLEELLGKSAFLKLKNDKKIPEELIIEILKTGEKLSGKLREEKPEFGEGRL